MDGTVVDVRSRRRAQTRDEIIAAAWTLAERDGIAGLSMRALAAAVGMRAPSLYTYVASKAAIYDEMFATGYVEFDAAMRRVPIDPSDPAGSMAASIEAFLDFCAASVARYQVMFTRAVPDWEPSPGAYEASRSAYAGMAQRLESLGIDAPAHLDLLTALTAGLAAQQHANDPGGARWRRLSRDAAEMFLSHVRRT